MEPLLLSAELSRRIELAEAKAAVACARVLQRLLPSAGAAVDEIAGGYAIFAGAGSPVTQAVGLGLNGDVNNVEVRRLEDFYRSRNEPVRVETSPLADPFLFRHFGESCYRVTEFTNVMARRIGADETPEAASDGVRVDRVPEGQVDLWSQTVSQGFAGDQPANPEILTIMRMFAMAEGQECYLARIGDVPAGGGTLAIRDGVAGLFGASTLPGYRNRGVQGALLSARLARAVEAGCDLAVCLAQPGSSSQKNIVRQGFTVLYTRVKFERQWK